MLEFRHGIVSQIGGSVAVGGNRDQGEEPGRIIGGQGLCLRNFETHAAQHRQAQVIDHHALDQAEEDHGDDKHLSEELVAVDGHDLFHDLPALFSCSGSIGGHDLI